MGIAGGTLGAPPPAAPAAAMPATAAARPLAGRRLALLADPSALASVAPGRRAAQRGHELGALRARRLGAQVDVVDDAALAAGALAGHDAVVVADGAAVSPSPPGAARRSPPSSPAAGRSSAGARGASRWRAPPGSRRPRSPRGAPSIWIPGAAVAVGRSVVVDNDDPLVAGGNVVAAYGAVLSGWTLGSPEGRPAILDEPVGAGRAVLFAFDPVFRGASESAEALLTSALTGATPGARRSACESQIASPSMHEQRHVALAGELVDLGAVALALRRPGPPRSSTPAPAQLARDAPARAQPVGRACGSGSRVAMAQRREAPQHAAGACAGRRPGDAQRERLARARRAPGARARARGTSRSSSAACPRGGRAASPARAWPWSSGTPTTATPRAPRSWSPPAGPGSRSAARAKASAAGSGQLERRRLDARQPRRGRRTGGRG